MKYIFHLEKQQRSTGSHDTWAVQRIRITCIIFFVSFLFARTFQPLALVIIFSLHFFLALLFQFQLTSSQSFGLKPLERDTRRSLNAKLKVIDPWPFRGPKTRILFELRKTRATNSLKLLPKRVSWPKSSLKMPIDVTQPSSPASQVTLLAQMKPIFK